MVQLRAKVCHLKQLFIATNLDRDVKESDLVSDEADEGEPRGAHDAHAFTKSFRRL
jgi:hypothetical protein